MLILPLRAASVVGAGAGAGWEYVAGYLLAVSAVTGWAYRHDKRRAALGGWRVPEARLHFLELIGGWPAAFVAQRVWHHKTAKKSYQAVFWLIVAVHQYVAFDFVRDWRWSTHLYESAVSFLTE